jgi:LuxR family maltose regulon positive regulatory protein
MLTMLLQTKLDAPLLRPDLVWRSRLIIRLDAGLGARLALVVAPAGFGKTTLVAEWANHLSRREDAACNVAWLSLDELDNEPYRFVAHLIAALQAVEPALGQVAQTLLSGSQLPPPEMVMTVVINDLAAASTPVVLVLDDYHVIRAEWVHTAMQFLVEHQPPSLHLVLVGREDPPLPLSRLRARGQIVEIRANDLRFTLDEAIAFLNQTMGLDLTTEHAATLGARTEGWIVGLQLAALALQEHHDPDAFIQAFSGSHRYVIDYLVDEVLRQQPPEVRDFLTQTSILERFCAPLCEAVVQTDPSAAGQGAGIDARGMLIFLERANLFLVPLDDERRWYRYHYLFADSLRAQLDPLQQAVLHRRAAQWFRDHDILPDAVRHALAAHDQELSADLLAEAGRGTSMWSGGDFWQYLTWVEALPQRAIEVRPRLQLCYGRALYLFGRLDEADRVLASAEEQLRAASIRDEELLSIAAAYRAQCSLERGNLELAEQLAEYAIAHLPSDVVLDRARARYALACARYAQGHMATAGRLFEQASHAAESQGALSLALSAGECAARCLVLQGRLEAARQKSEHVIALGQVGGTRHPLIAGALLVQAEIAYQQNRLDRVEPLAGQAIALAGQMGALVRGQQCWAYLQLARLHHARGDPERAIEAILCADEIAREVSNAFYLRVSAARQERRLSCPEQDRAIVLHEPAYMPTVFYALAEFEALAQACHAIVQQRPRDALPIVDQLLDVARHDGRNLDAITLTIWRALALQVLGQEDAAADALGVAVVLAAPQHCVRPFLDVGPAVGRLLQQPALRSIGGDFTVALLDELAAGVQGSQPRASARASRPLAPARPSFLIEPLSSRELDVLSLIAEGLSNKEIAGRLLIGVGTVKWYATTIYSKLDVGSRTQAVARAQELGLLS